MRLIFAFVYMATGMWLYTLVGGSDFHPAFGFVLFFGLMFSSVIVCNKGFLRLIKGQSDEEYIEELLKFNKARIENYTVTEAISFEDLGTGRLCHLLRSKTDKVICLYGQYLYEYAEIVDDPELNQKRMFPTTEFSIVRQIKNGEILRLDIGDTVLDEIRLENINMKKLSNVGIKIEDGEIINDVSFDKIKDICKDG